MTGSSLLARYHVPPEEIEARSIALVERLTPRLPSDAAEREVVVRLVHATGDPEVAASVRMSPGAVAAGAAALRAGRPIFVDVGMALAGISRRLADRLGCRVSCLLDLPGVAEEARRSGSTRAAAAVWLAGPQLSGGVVAIGNAPTALLSLLDLVDAGRARPALVVGMPVGFVAAAESKAELARRAVPFITIEGTRGGSAVAAAACNALLRLAVDGWQPQDARGEGGRSRDR